MHCYALAFDDVDITDDGRIEWPLWDWRNETFSLS